MTGLLQKALRRIEVLSEEEQNAIAMQILESLDDEETWTRKLREHPELLRSLAREASEEHRRGDTRPLDETIGRSRPQPGDFAQPTQLFLRESSGKPA